MPVGQCLNALSLSTANFLPVKAEAGRPSCGGRRTVCCVGTALKCRVRQCLSVSGRVICAWQPRRVCVVGAPMFSRPTCGSTLSRSAASLTRRSSGAPTAGRATAPRYSCFRAAGCRRPLNSTLGQPNANANRRMSESFVALPLPIACPSRPRRAVRPSAAGAPTVASAPP